jgi:hypothetical protein
MVLDGAFLRTMQNPQIIYCILGEKSVLNLCLWACITGKKNFTVICQRKKKSLHNAFTFPSKHINKIKIFSKYVSNDSRIYIYNIPFSWKYSCAATPWKTVSHDKANFSECVLHFSVLCGFLRNIYCFSKIHAQHSITVGFKSSQQGICGFKYLVPSIEMPSW